MEIDYISMIPEPPADIVQWLKNKGCFSKQWLIFKCGWERELLSEMKMPCFDVICTACGKHFKADREENYIPGCHQGYYGMGPYSYYRGRAGESVIQDDKETICPLCGAKVTCMHVSRMKNGEFNWQWPMVVSKKDENLILSSFRVVRHISKLGQESFTVNKYEAYIFTPQKAYRFCGWEQCYFGSKWWLSYWEPRKRFNDQYGEAEEIYYSDPDILKGTRFENCKFDLYFKNFKSTYPVKFFKLFNKHPQIENFLVQGYFNLVQEAVNNSLGYEPKAFSWKEKSPRKILGLNRPDFDFLKKAKATSQEIFCFKKFREYDMSISQGKILGLIREFSTSASTAAAANDMTDLLKFNINPWRTVRYIKKQSKKGKISETVQTWHDYMKMASAVGYDIKSDVVCFPPNLKDAHDRAIMAQKYKTDQKLISQFKNMYQKCLPFAFEKDGLIIRPAKTEDELIIEGKVLQHCVGGYGHSHCEGKPIFFIRKSSDPDMPYYTLQLDLIGKHIIQNRGRNNCPRTPEIKTFEDYWLEHVVKAEVKPQTEKKKKQRAA